MPMFEQIATLEDRTLAMPQLHTLLEALYRKHMALHDVVTADRLARAAGFGADKTDYQEMVMYAAIHAGFIEEIPTTAGVSMRLCLSDKGYAAIGKERPFWQKHLDPRRRLVHGHMTG